MNCSIFKPFIYTQLFGICCFHSPMWDLKKIAILV
jgi:hypothetical protein